MKPVEICWNDITKEKQEEIIRVIGGDNNYDALCKKVAAIDRSITIEIFNDNDDDSLICVYIKSDECTGYKNRLSPTCTLADVINEYLTVHYPYSYTIIGNL